MKVRKQKYLDLGSISFNFENLKFKFKILLSILLIEKLNYYMSFMKDVGGLGGGGGEY